MSLFADASLASRLESLCAAEMRRFVETALQLDPACGAAALELAGGTAAFLGVGSPLNQAFGLGFGAEVTPEDIASLEEFYTSRAARPLIGASPLAHPSLFASLAARGWVLDGFENVLVRPVESSDAEPPALPDGVSIHEVSSEADRRTWILLAATAFSAPLPPLDVQLEIGRIVVRRPGSRLFIVAVEGQPAGTGELYVEDGVAWLSADSTLPAFRRRGAQRAVQAHRLFLAAQAGCELAATESAPGGASQRNMERLGFRIAYTRVDMALPGVDAQP